MSAGYIYDPEAIWDMLLKRTENVAGAAAIISCLAVGTDLEFANKIDRGEITQEKLRKTRRQFGIGRWTRWEDKQGLYNLSKDRGVSISDLEMQVDFLWEDVGREKYGDLKKQLMVAKDVDKLCQLFMDTYQPQVKRTDEEQKERIRLAKEFYRLHAEKELEVSYIRILKDNVPVRKTPSLIGKKIDLVHKDQEFQHLITSKSGNWYSIYIANRIGWVSSRYGELITRVESVGEHYDSVG